MQFDKVSPTLGPVKIAGLRIEAGTQQDGRKTRHMASFVGDVRVTTMLTPMPDTLGNDAEHVYPDASDTALYPTESVIDTCATSYR